MFQTTNQSFIDFPATFDDTSLLPDSWNYPMAISIHPFSPRIFQVSSKHLAFPSHAKKISYMYVISLMRMDFHSGLIHTAITMKLKSFQTSVKIKQPSLPTQIPTIGASINIYIYSLYMYTLYIYNYIYIYLYYTYTQQPPQGDVPQLIQLLSLHHTN